MGLILISDYSKYCWKATEFSFEIGGGKILFWDRVEGQIEIK